MTPNELKRVYLFEKMTMEELSDLWQRSTDRQVKPGDFLFREGDRAQSLFVLELGSLKISRKLRKSAEDTVVIAAGVLGEMGYLHREVRSADVMAVESVRVREIPYTALDDLRKKNAGFGERLFAAIAGLLGDKIKNLPSDVSALNEMKVRFQ